MDDIYSASNMIQTFGQKEMEIGKKRRQKIKIDHDLFHQKHKSKT